MVYLLKRNTSQKKMKTIKPYLKILLLNSKIFITVFDEDNFFDVEFKKKGDDLKINYFIVYSKSNDIDDSFDEIERENIIVEYNENKINNKIEDNLEELYEKYIIDNELIDKLFTKGKNPFFYIIN